MKFKEFNDYLDKAYEGTNEEHYKILLDNIKK